MRKGILSIIMTMSIATNVYCISTGQFSKEPKESQVNLKSNLLITAAHLGDIDGYTLLYKDDKRDTGYYLKNNIELSTINIQHVKVDGLEDCVISQCYDGGFIISTSRKDLVHTGLSGARVKTLDGKDIGFISSLLKDGTIDCKNLE